MINRIIASILFVCLMLAISLSLFGVTHVELGQPFLNFMGRCSRDLDSFKIAIPNIPMIPNIEVDNAADNVLNFLINFLNGLSTLINFLILIVNTLIQLIEFFIIVIRNLIILRDTLVSA